MKQNIEPNAPFTRVIFCLPDFPVTVVWSTPITLGYRPIATLF